MKLIKLYKLNDEKVYSLIFKWEKIKDH